MGGLSQKGTKATRRQQKAKNTAEETEEALKKAEETEEALKKAEELQEALKKKAEENEELQKEVNALKNQAAASKANQEEDDSDEEVENEALKRAEENTAAAVGALKKVEEALNEALKKAEEAEKRVEKALKTAEEAEKEANNLKEITQIQHKALTGFNAIVRVQAYPVPTGVGKQVQAYPVPTGGVVQPERGIKKIRGDVREYVEKEGILPMVQNIMYRANGTFETGKSILSVVATAIGELKKLKKVVADEWAVVGNMTPEQTIALHAKAAELHEQAFEVFQKLRYIQDERSKSQPVNYLQDKIAQVSTINNFSVLFLESADMNPKDTTDYLFKFWIDQEHLFNKAKFDLEDFILEGGSACGEECPCGEECKRKNELLLNRLNVEHYITFHVLETVHKMMEAYMPDDADVHRIPAMPVFDLGTRGIKRSKTADDRDTKAIKRRKTADVRDTTPGRDEENPQIFSEVYANPNLTRNDGGVVRDGRGSEAAKAMGGRVKRKAIKLTSSAPLPNIPVQLANTSPTQYPRSDGGYFHN